MNKLSEEHIRKEKVNKLKEKVLKEVNEKLEENRKELRFYLEELNEEEKTNYRLIMILILIYGYKKHIILQVIFCLILKI